MKHVVLLFALALGLTANAAEYSPALDKDFDRIVPEGKFYKAESTPIIPRNFARAVAASVRIGASGETCSASIISKDGYAVTAAHCVDKCLKPSWNYQPKIQVEWPSRGEKGSVYEGMRVLEQVPSRLDCPTHMLNGYYVWDFDLTNPKIIWLGRGYLYGDEKQIAKLSPAEFSGIQDLTEDVAILKYEFAGGKRDIPCVPVVDAKPRSGAPLWAIGHPVQGPGYDHNGYKEYVSLGRTRASITQDPVLLRYAAEIDAADQAPFWSYQKALWQKDSLLLSSLKAAHGNSGGMIVDENGELAAVLFSIIKTTQIYNASTVIGVSLPHLRERLHSAFGRAKTEEIFNCPR